MPRPGIMIYFEVRKPLAWLPDAEKGQLFDAILEYGETGLEPEFDGMLAMAWSFIQPKLDRDQNEYDKTVLKRQFAAFCRKLKSKCKQEISFDEWLAMSEEDRDHMVSHDITWYPTTTATTTTTTAVTPTATTNTTATTTTKSTSTAITTAAAAGNKKANDGADAPDAAAAAERHRLEFIQGTLGQGLVKLTPFQFDLLLDELGIEMFDHYVAKLADFIKRRGAVPGNHYNTIRKWFREDSGTEG